MPNVLRLVRASATFPELRGSSDVVRAGIAEAAIASQHIAVGALPCPGASD